VKRAVFLAENSLKRDKKPIWFLGSLVHNEKVLERFRRKNVKFISSPKQVESGTLIIQAHGSPPFSEKISKKLLIRDATCPLVKKVQTLANSLYRKGYQVIIIGDRSHSETKGINGYAGNKSAIIENERQARKLPEFKKIGVVVQTTQRLENFKKILKILKKKSRNIKWFNTICPEVDIRQKELDEISKKSDAILVIGSRSSANTKRLVQIARKSKKKVFLVNSLEGLRKKKIKGISALGVVSGTSASGREVRKIKRYLMNITDD
jgi:4-hydroxy-3-methylbut-2-enyl diphosphate reductase